MNVRKIVEQWLKENGYDGLTGDGCCCAINDDLFHCGESSCACEPGIKKLGCSPECGEGCDFHMIPK